MTCRRALDIAFFLGQHLGFGHAEDRAEAKTERREQRGVVGDDAFEVRVYLFPEVGQSRPLTSMAAAVLVRTFSLVSGIGNHGSNGSWRNQHAPNVSCCWRSRAPNYVELAGV